MSKESKFKVGSRVRCAGPGWEKDEANWREPREGKWFAEVVDHDHGCLIVGPDGLPGVRLAVYDGQCRLLKKKTRRKVRLHTDTSDGELIHWDRRHANRERSSKCLACADFIEVRRKGE